MNMPIAQIIEDCDGCIRKLLEADARLLPHPVGYPQFLQQRLSAGHAFLDRRLPAVRYSAPDYFEMLSRIAGQGVVMAEEMLFQWGTGHEACANAVDACALFNLMIASFDHVIDNRPSGAIELRKVMSRPRIVAALAADSRDANSPVFGHENPGDPAVTFVAEIGEKFFAECRGLRLENPNRAAWDRFAEAVLGAYDAELATVDLPLSSGDALIQAVDQKAALSGALIANVILLCPCIRSDIDLAAAIEMMEALGRLSGVVDDLCDLVDDIKSGQVNSLLLAVADILPMERQSWKAPELLERVPKRRNREGIPKRCES